MPQDNTKQNSQNDEVMDSTANIDSGSSNNNEQVTLVETENSKPNSVNSEPSSSFPGSTNNQSNEKPARKTIATILGIILLVAGVAAGVLLVNQNAEFRTKAWDCEAYVFEVSQDGVVTVRNGSTRDEPEQNATVTINGTLVATLDVPPLNAGEAATLGSVTVPTNGFTWEVVGSKDCSDQGSYQVTQTPTPTSEPTQTPSTTPALTPTTTQITAECSLVVAYDTNWNVLTSGDLSNLKPGDVVRFAVTGTTSSGNFDKARFTINGTLRPEVTNQKPGTEEFYDQYTIPTGTTTFNVDGEIHHEQLNQWF